MGNCFHIQDDVRERKPSPSLFLLTPKQVITNNLVVPQVYHPPPFVVSCA